MPIRLEHEILGLAAFTALAFTGSLATKLMTPALSFFLREELRASFLGVSTLTAGYMMGRSLTAYFSGRICGRWVKLVPSFSLALNGFLTLLYPMASWWYEVSIISFLQGALMGLTWPLIQYLVMAIAPRGSKGRAISSYFFVGSLAGPAGDAIYGTFFGTAAVASVVVVSLSFYVLSAVLAYIGSSLATREVPPSKGDEKSVNPGEREPDWRLPWLLVLGLGMGGVGSIIGSSLIYILLREWFYLSRGAVAYVLSIIGGFTVGSRLLSGYLVDRYGLRATLRSLASLLAVGILLVGVKELLTVITGLLITSIAVGALIPASRTYAYQLPDPAGAVGKLNSLGNVGTVLGLLAIGAGMDMLKLPVRWITPIIVFLMPFAALVVVSSIRLYFGERTP